MPGLQQALGQRQGTDGEQQEPSQHLGKGVAALPASGPHTTGAGDHEAAARAATVAQGEGGRCGIAGGAEQDGGAVDGDPLPGGQSAEAELDHAPRRQRLTAGQR